MLQSHAGTVLMGGTSEPLKATISIPPSVSWGLLHSHVRGVGELCSEWTQLPLSLPLTLKVEQPGLQPLVSCIRLACPAGSPPPPVRQTVAHDRPRHCPKAPGRGDSAFPPYDPAGLLPASPAAPRRAPALETKRQQFLRSGQAQDGRDRW